MSVSDYFFFCAGGDMKQDETKAMLREGAIRTVARDGLEKASTKLISYEANVNEAFIFRYYGGKDNLLDETFRALDEELVREAVRRVNQVRLSMRSSNERAAEVIGGMWELLMDHKNEVLFFIRYYYSAAFLRIANERHLATTQELVDLVTNFAKSERSARTMVMGIFDGLLNMAMQVQLGNVPDDRRTRDAVSCVFAGMAMNIANSGEIQDK